MAMVCRQFQEWVEQKIEKPIEGWENRQKRRCKKEDCNWWMLCLNKLFCWLAWVFVKVVRWVLVTVGKWVVRAVCEVVAQPCAACANAHCVNSPSSSGLKRARSRPFICSSAAADALFSPRASASYVLQSA